MTRTRATTPSHLRRRPASPSSPPILTRAESRRANRKEQVEVGRARGIQRRRRRGPSGVAAPCLQLRVPGAEAGEHNPTAAITNWALLCQNRPTGRQHEANQAHETVDRRLHFVLAVIGFMSPSPPSPRKQPRHHFLRHSGTISALDGLRRLRSKERDRAPGGRLTIAPQLTRDCRRVRTCAEPTDRAQVRGREAAGLRQSEDLLTCFRDTAQQARTNPGC
jgi:hypothetical protein